jgi:hypothetical protein
MPKQVPVPAPEGIQETEFDRQHRRLYNVISLTTDRKIAIDTFLEVIENATSNEDIVRLGTVLQNLQHELEQARRPLERPPAGAETLDWLADTPRETEYSLEMCDPDGNLVQGVDLTRAEFIELKRHLAAQRGYRAPDGRE